jgi:hypothetical protein
MSKLEIPDFPSEAEEAKWWFDHQDALDDEFLAAAAEGRLGVGTAARLAGLPERSVELSWDDFELAKREAEKRGIKYQDYVSSLLHTALITEANAA